MACKRSAVRFRLAPPVLPPQNEDLQTSPQTLCHCGELQLVYASSEDGHSCVRGDCTSYEVSYPYQMLSDLLAADCKWSAKVWVPQVH